MNRSFKYRLRPTESQVQVLKQTLSLCCSLYNAALEERKDAYRCPQHIEINYKQQQNELPALKKDFIEFNIVHSQVLQDVLKRLDRAFQSFFLRCKSGKKPGYPRFRSENRYDSFTYPQGGFWIREKTIKLSKIGEVKCIFHRKMLGKVKTCSIKREGNDWYVVFSCELIPRKCLSRTGEEVGIDVGIENFITLSNGEIIANPRFSKKASAKLRRAQRKLARAKKGSNRRKKQASRLYKQHLKIRRQRRDFHFKTAAELIKRFDIIHFEKLNIRNMLRNKKLSFSIADAAWYQFQQITRCKAEEAGKECTFNDARNSSNECSASGEIKKKNLSQRWHNLPNGSVIHRDHNAAINILRRGQRRQSITQGL